MEHGRFFLTIVCPEKDFFEDEVNEVVFSTPEGSIGIMAGHAPMIAAVSEGVVEILADGDWKIAAVGPGFCEIGYHKAEFYLDTAEWADEIDVAMAKEELERAEQRIRSEMSQQEYVLTQASMSRDLARLKAVRSREKHRMVVR
jgi:F-type H+-transporting ATPase subunit epsilon